MFTRIARAFGREFNAVSQSLIDHAPAYLLAMVLAILIGGCVRAVRELPEVPHRELTLEETIDRYSLSWMP